MMDFKQIARNVATESPAVSDPAMDFKQIARDSAASVTTDAQSVLNWYTDNVDVAKKLEEYSKGEYWGNPDTGLLDSITRQMESAASVQRYINANREALGDDFDAANKEYDKYMGFLRDAKDYVSKRNDIYSAYETKEDYDAAVEEMKNYQDLESYNLKTAVPYTIRERKDFDDVKRMIEQRNTIMSAPTYTAEDAEEAEQLTKDIARVMRKYGYDASYAFGGVAGVEAINTNDQLLAQWEKDLFAQEQYVDKALEIQTYNKVLSDLQELREKYHIGGGDATVDEDKRESLRATDEWLYNALINGEDLMEKDERAVFVSLVNEGKNYADLARRYKERVIDKRAAEAHVKWWYEYAQKDPVGSWITARGLDIASAGEFLLKFLGQGFNQKSGLAETSQIISQAHTDAVDWKIGEWDAFDTLYGTVSSLANSAILLPLGKISLLKSAGSAVLGLEAAASAHNAALDRGMTGAQAMMTGLFAGTAEAVFEKYSIDSLLAMKKVGVSGVKDLAKNIAKSMITNASEETLTEIANSVYDILANGDFSQFETEVRQLMQSGMSEEDARMHAFGSLVAQVGESGLSGLLMGLPFGAGASISSWRKSSALGKTVNDADFLVAVAKQLDDGSRAQQLAAEVEAGNTRNAKLGALLSEVTAELEKKGEAKAKEIYAAAEASLEARVTEDADSFTDEDVEEFNAAVNFDATREELLDAAAKNAADAEAAPAEMPKKSDYIPPKSAADVKSYSDAQTDKLSRKLSRNVYKYDGSDRIDAEDGFYDAKTNSIYINKNHPLNRMSYATVLAHEYVHSLEIASEDYKALRDAVFSSSVYARYLKSAGTGKRVSLTHDQYVQQIIKDYGFTGTDAVERAEQEALAKVLARDFLRNEATLVELARQDRNLFMRLWAWVRRMIARLGKSEETLKLEALFRKAAKASTVAHNAKAAAQTDATTDTASETQKHPTEDGEVQYDFDESFGDQLNDWLINNGKAGKHYNGTYFVLGTTPSSLTKHGAPEGEVIMYEECLDKITGLKHTIALDELSKIPSSLNDPILLFNGSKHKSLVALTELQAKNGHDVLVIIHIDKRHKRSVINKIASVYSKTDEETEKNKIVGYVMSQIRKGNLVDASTKKAPIWFTNRGLQLPKLVQTIIDANNKIAQNDPIVKTKSMQVQEDYADKSKNSSEDSATGDSVQHSLPAISKEVADAVFEKAPDTSDPSTSLQYSLGRAREIGEKSESVNRRLRNVSAAVLKVGIDTMIEMADVMRPFLDKDGILPPDVEGRTIFKNGSYGRTGENSLLCIRTLTYEDFKDRVAKELGRPLTVAESLLVSQKIYDIAVDPQCIYCYVAADRKAYDEYIGEYWKAMDKYIQGVRNGGDADALFDEYLNGRSRTNAQAKRKAMWDRIANSGKAYITSADLATRARREAVISDGGAFAEQVRDAKRYAQSASWAKSVADYRAYKGDILNLKQTLIDTLNNEYGLRMYSFSDYTPAFIVENMQMIIDAAVRGLKSLAYTKDTAYAKIFASTGQAINVSCFAKYDHATKSYVEDSRQGASWSETKALRDQYRNVGAVMVCTNDAMVEWALAQDWIDIVIPYHIVKTGTKIANEYDWKNYTAESSDRIGSKTANIYPTEHNNSFDQYRRLVEERGITPRFDRFYQRAVRGEISGDQYMKLVNEVRLPASELDAVVPIFDLDAAYDSFGVTKDGEIIKGGFVDKGGYMGGWYREGVDVAQEVQTVAGDILAGKSSLDVDYGMNAKAKKRQSDKYDIQLSIPDRTASQYLEKMLADPSIAKATKAQIYADSPLYDVLHDPDRFAAAREILRNRDQLVDVVKRVSKGEAATAEEITAMILMQNAATTGAEQANASYIVATAARVAGRALRAFDRHNKLYTQMTPEDRAVALLEDTKADALQDAFRLQNRFIDYKLHKGAGDFIDQVVLAFYAEAGVDQLSEKALGEKVIEIIANAEDVLGYDGSELRGRVKGRLLKAFENKELVKYLHDLMKSGNAPIDAIRMAINKAVHIKSMTNSELKTVIGYAEGVADLRIKWFEAENADEARQINVEIDAATSEMLDYIAEHMTISGVERMRSWRKTAMLSNVRTHFRNVVSNVAMLPIQRGDQKIAALLERSIFHKHGIRDHTFATWSATKHGKQILDYVEKLADYEAMIGGRYLGYGTDVVATEEGKALAEKDAKKLKEEYNFDFNANEIAMRRKMFGARENFLNRVADFNSRWLEKEDVVFYRRAFRSALGQLMVANKATEATELMIRNARAQALEAVFKADNALYCYVSRVKNTVAKSDTISRQMLAKVVQEALDAIVPFTKTPTNIVKAIFDHSVLGLAWTFARHVTHNVMNKSNESLYMDQLIMQYAKGIQGSLWTVVGFALGLAGIIVTDEEDDWEYDELTGGTKYALKLGDVYFSLDWLQPASASFLIGATVGESMKDANSGNPFIDAIGGTVEAAMSTFDFAMDQSYFSSLKDLFSGPAYEDFDFGVDAIGGLLISYIMQFMPTSISQTARVIDPVQRKVRTGEFGSTLLNTVLSRLPGASMLLEPRTSVWGDDVRRNNAQDDLGGWISNALQQYVLPSTISGREYPGDNTTEELLSLFDRVAESGGSTTAIFNENDMKDWVDKNGKALDTEQYREYDRSVRKAFKAALDDLTASAEWSGMTDAEKSKAVSETYSDIRAAAKKLLKEGTAYTANAEISALATALSANGGNNGNTDTYTLTLSNGQFLPENGYLYNRYESAIDEHYEALVREASVGWFTFSKNGVDYKIRLNDCTPEERALAEESLKKRAVNHIRKMFEGVDPAALEDALRSSNGHTAYKRLKSMID